jgi:hypothetical protein
MGYALGNACGIAATKYTAGRPSGVAAIIFPFTTNKLPSLAPSKTNGEKSTVEGLSASTCSRIRAGQWNRNLREAS